MPSVTVFKNHADGICDGAIGMIAIAIRCAFMSLRNKIKHYSGDNSTGLFLLIQKKEITASINQIMVDTGTHNSNSGSDIHHIFFDAVVTNRISCKQLFVTFKFADSARLRGCKNSMVVKKTERYSNFNAICELFEIARAYLVSVALVRAFFVKIWLVY